MTLTLSNRASGVLLHPTSLPGPHGIGDLGPEAFTFVDFLSASQQTWWQMFPLGPPGYGSSPYQPISAFAGNPLLISLDLLVKEGLLSPSDLKSAPPFLATKVEFDKVRRFKYSKLRKAFKTFVKKAGAKTVAFAEFCRQHRSWLDDYALFCALKSHHGGMPWPGWEEGVRQRSPAALKKARERLMMPIYYHEFLQFLFFKQWSELKAYAARKGVGLIGDIPIFVAHDSADVWAAPTFFYLNSKGHPLYIAGTPPDYFSRTGQKWGNPLYNWDAMKQDGFKWWIKRVSLLTTLVDALRLDHFIGFERYWRIPAGDKTARNGKWVPGPKTAFFDALLKALGPCEIIAEDLGVVGDDVRGLRDQYNFPGMKILQFAFGDGRASNPYLPHNFSRRCIVYTGTHDNNTTIGWFQDEPRSLNPSIKKVLRQERNFALSYMNSRGTEIHWDLIRLAFMSVADTAMIPMQDLLGLGQNARMNIPGTSRGNWAWRLRKGAVNESLINRLSDLTKLSGRVVSK